MGTAEFVAIYKSITSSRLEERHARRGNGVEHANLGTRGLGRTVKRALGKGGKYGDVLPLLVQLVYCEELARYG